MFFLEILNTVGVRGCSVAAGGNSGNRLFLAKRGKTGKPGENGRQHYRGLYTPPPQKNTILGRYQPLRPCSRRIPEKSAVPPPGGWASGGGGFPHFFFRGAGPIPKMVF